MAWLTVPATDRSLCRPAPVGGFITTFISWHWIFSSINVPRSGWPASGIAGRRPCRRSKARHPAVSNSKGLCALARQKLKKVAASGQVVFGLSVVSDAGAAAGRRRGDAFYRHRRGGRLSASRKEVCRAACWTWGC